MLAPAVLIASRTPSKLLLLASISTSKLLAPTLTVSEPELKVAAEPPVTDDNATLLPEASCCTCRLNLPTGTSPLAVAVSTDELEEETVCF